jgi:cell division septation protein DedD
MSPTTSNAKNRLAGSAVVVAALVAALPAAVSASTSESPERTTANRLVEKVNVAGVEAMGESFSCAASPLASKAPQVIVYVLSSRDRKTAEAIARRLARGLGDEAGALPVNVRVGQQVRARSTLLKVAAKLNRHVDTERGQRAFVAGGAGKARCGRVQLYIGSSPTTTLSQWAKAQRHRYGTTRIRVVRSLIGSAAG